MYALWLCFVALQRLLELWISRRNIARLPPAERARVSGGRAAWTAMVALHTALIVLPALEVHVRQPHPRAWLVAVCFAAFCAAQALRVATLFVLGPAWNARGVVARTLPSVSRGPYALVRHPNYAAVVIEFSAIPLGGGAWWSWIVLNLLHAPLLAARIRAEERWLAEDEHWRRTMAHKPCLFPWPWRIAASGRAR